MPRTKEQYDTLRTQKKELIENAAMECFAAMGFHGTSINVIAKKARISAGLMYNYFSSKDDLLTSVFMKGINRIFSKIAQMETMDHAGFLDFIEHIFNEIKANIKFWKLYFIVMSQPDIIAKYQDQLMITLGPMIFKIAGYFESRGIPDPEIETRMLFALLDGVCMNYIAENEHYPLTKIKNKILKQYGQ